MNNINLIIVLGHPEPIQTFVGNVMSYNPEEYSSFFTFYTRRKRVFTDIFLESLFNQIRFLIDEKH